MPVIRSLLFSWRVSCGADLNQSDESQWWRLFRVMPTQVLWKCLVCPQNVNVTISIWFIQNIFCHILKMKSTQAFMNGNKSLMLGLCRRIMTCCVHDRARDYAQNRSLTCGKDCTTNFYSLSNNKFGGFVLSKTGLVLQTLYIYM